MSLSNDWALTNKKVRLQRVVKTNTITLFKGLTNNAVEYLQNIYNE